jgi:hypothetical protein
VFASVVDPPNRRGEQISVVFTVNDCKQAILAYIMLSSSNIFLEIKKKLCSGFICVWVPQSTICGTILQFRFVFGFSNT